MKFALYVDKLVHGDLGTSWQTTRPMLGDLRIRFPATLELVTYGMLLALLIGIPLGIASALRMRGPLAKLGGFYGLVAGALPDFWLALILIYIFYSLLGWVRSPIGRIDVIIMRPKMITGFYTIDSLLTGNWATLRSSVHHLILPVVTLGLVNAGPILKMTQATMERMLDADFSFYARLWRLPEKLVVRHALRNAMPSIIMIVSVLYGFLIGGAVLIEIVFSWGGAGQYAVQGVLNSDFNPVLGFVIFSGRDLAMIVANPRGELNPLRRAGTQIATVAEVHLGVSHRRGLELALEMLRAVAIPDPERRLRAYPHELSGGMAQRIVIAMALICAPRFVISDDATSGLDVTVQAQVLERLKKLVREQNTPMLYITRDIGVAANFCDRIAIIYKGEIVEVAPTEAFLAGPAHPYSNSLLAAFAHKADLRRRWTASDHLSSPTAACLYADRCVRRQARCLAKHPELEPTPSGRLVRCHFPVER